MPVITIRRGGGWTDRFRAYSVRIDGVECGSLRANSVARFDVTAGRHDVQVWVGLAYRSNILAVDVGAGDKALACRSNAIPFLAILSLARPDRWIALEEA